MWRITIIVAILLTSCSDEFIPFMEGSEPTTVLYGFINVDDTVNSVRITKSFYGSTSAYELARDTNLVFYQNLTAKIQCLVDESAIYSEYALIKTYIPIDTTGIFQTPKNWVYTYHGYFPPRDSFRSIRVIVVLPQGDTVQTTRLHVFSKPRMINPNSATSTISLYDNGAYAVRIEHYMKVGFKMRVNYSEKINGHEENCSLEKFYYNNTSKYYIGPNRFLTMLNENITDNTNVEYRRLIGIDFVGYVAGNGLIFYHNSLGKEYDFTNSPYNYVENGTGLVLPYSKDSIMGVQFDNQTMDSLVNGESFKKFKFVKWN